MLNFILGFLTVIIIELIILIIFLYKAKLIDNEQSL
jgi:hypothetical protein